MIKRLSLSFALLLLCSTGFVDAGITEAEAWHGGACVTVETLKLVKDGNKFLHLLDDSSLTLFNELLKFVENGCKVFDGVDVLDKLLKGQDTSSVLEKILKKLDQLDCISNNLKSMDHKMDTISNNLKSMDDKMDVILSRVDVILSRVGGHIGNKPGPPPKTLSIKPSKVKTESCPSTSTLFSYPAKQERVVYRTARPFHY